MSERFDPYSDYAVTGKRLNALARISRALNEPTSLIWWDQRRDAANMIELILMEAIKLLPPDTADSNTPNPG